MKVSASQAGGSTDTSFARPTHFGPRDMNFPGTNPTTEAYFHYPPMLRRAASGVYDPFIVHEITLI